MGDTLCQWRNCFRCLCGRWPNTTQKLLFLDKRIKHNRLWLSWSSLDYTSKLRTGNDTCHEKASANGWHGSQWDHRAKIVSNRWSTNTFEKMWLFVPQLRAFVLKFSGSYAPLETHSFRIQPQCSTCKAKQVGDTDRAVSLSFDNWTPMMKKKPVDFSMDTRNQPRSLVGNRCESASI
jgi:hypothetical protein